MAFLTVRCAIYLISLQCIHSWQLDCFCCKCRFIGSTEINSPYEHLNGNPKDLDLLILINSLIAWFLLSVYQDDLEAELACLEFDLENEEVFESNETPTAAVGECSLLYFIAMHVAIFICIIQYKYFSADFSPGTELPLSPTSAAYTLPSAPNNVATLPTSDQVKGTNQY